MARHKNKLPLLCSVKLVDLPSLISFYSGSNVLQCPRLKEIDVINCPKMETFVSALSSKSDSGTFTEGNKEPCKGCFNIPVAPIFSGKVCFAKFLALHIAF